MTSSAVTDENTITVAMRMTDSNVTCLASRPETEVHLSGAAMTARAVIEVVTLFVFFSLSVVGNVLVCLSGDVLDSLSLVGNVLVCLSGDVLESVSGRQCARLSV